MNPPFVYELSASSERRRPQIEVSASVKVYGTRWDYVGEVLDGVRPLSDYKELRFIADKPDVAAWDAFAASTTFGLFSGRAVSVIGRETFRNFELLPAKIDGVDFFLPCCLERLNCFDREHSEYAPLRGSNLITEVTKYAFRKYLITDPLVFAVPELLFQLFCTPTVKEAIVRAGLRGFHFEELDR